MDEGAILSLIAVAQSAAEIGVSEIVEPTIREAGIPLVALPQGEGKVELKSVKALLDEWRTAPERRVGVARMLTISALGDFIVRHKDDDSVIFADLDATVPSITAVFDYHRADHAPRHGKHRAVYLFPLSAEWKAWKLRDGAAMTQSDWAAFIEEHVAELATPHAEERAKFEALFGTKIGTPAELIGLSRGMQVTVESKIGEFRTLQSGEVEVSYTEVHKDGRGEKLIVPGLFLLNIPFFVDSAPTRVLARLRYRKAGGSLSWFYQLYRADAEIRAAMRTSAESVAAACDLPLYEGAQEA